MNTTTVRIIKFEFSDVLRSKWVLIYGLFFFLLTETLFRFGGTSARVMLSLSNVVLIIVPLICIVYGTIYLYNAREFMELMLAQPQRRRSLFGGLYSGLVIPLNLSFLVGVGLPFLLHGVERTAHLQAFSMLLLAGVFLTLIFIALAFLISTAYEDKMKGLGIAILSWLLFSVAYDGVMLSLIYRFSDYPLEKAVIALTLLNPVDLARTLLLMQLDIAALMGYTGAVFELFFGSIMGAAISLAALSLWVICPMWLGLRQFRRKDF